MTESEQAGRIASDWLNFKMNPLVQMVHGDPDCDAVVLARQYERVASMHQDICGVAGRLVEALEKIRDLEPEPFVFPTDWSEQIEACPECRRYRGHPIQQGI